MNPRDLCALQAWLRSGATLEEIESMPRFGMVDNERFTEQARRAYRLLWLWSAPRFGGEYGRRHDRAYARLGAQRYQRRIERALAAIVKLRGNP